MRDLFGEIPVSAREVELWLYLVPRIPQSSPRRASYTRQWNVPAKIRREKLAGTLAGIFQDEACEYCGQRLYPEVPADLGPDPAIRIQELEARVAALQSVIRALCGVRSDTDHELRACITSGA